MYILLCGVTITALSVDLTYISLLIIFCIVVYVMNTNLELQRSLNIFLLAENELA